MSKDDKIVVKEVFVLKKFFFQEFLYVITEDLELYVFTRKEKFITQIKDQRQINAVLEWLHI